LSSASDHRRAPDQCGRIRPAGHPLRTMSHPVGAWPVPLCRPRRCGRTRRSAA
jgi:hypothetical protein